ncbi:MAG: hypothetical protein IKR58_07065 [Lachnospiraceae bacterium]|nr:hypothetical protein [Lachnospiraceae bacterium]
MESRYSKKQRIAAIIGLALTFALLIGLVLSALFDQGGRLFQAFLFASIGVPILCWIYIWLYGRMTGKKTIADFRPDSDKPTDGQAPAGGSAPDDETITITKRHPHR